MGNRWTVPGGHIELGETVEETLKREIKEEIGLEIEPMHACRLVARAVGLCMH